MNVSIFTEEGKVKTYQQEKVGVASDIKTRKTIYAQQRKTKTPAKKTHTDKNEETEKSQSSVTQKHKEKIDQLYYAVSKRFPRSKITEHLGKMVEEAAYNRLAQDGKKSDVTHLIHTLERKKRVLHGEQFYVNGEIKTKQQVINILDTQIENLKKSLENWDVMKNIDLTTGKPKWEKIPVKDWKFYPNAKEKFSEYKTDTEKKTVLENAYGKNYIKNAIKQYKSVIPFSLPEGVKDFKDRVFQKLQKYPIDKRDKNLEKAVISVLWESLSDVEIYRKYYKKLHPVERVVKSFFHGAGESFFSAVTFPEFVIEEVGGRIVSGKKVDILPFSEKIHEGYAKLGGTTGLISYGIEKGISAATGKQQESIEEKEKEMIKYPLESFSGTLGEIAGIYAGGKTLSIGRTAFLRSGAKFYKPLKIRYPRIERISEKMTYYSPKEILLRSYYGRVSKSVKPETWLGKSDVSGFVHSTPRKTMKAFHRFPGKKPGTYTFGHATGYRMRSGRIWMAKISKGKRPGEMPGLSISPKGMVQERFLRLTREIPSYESKMTIFPKMKRPAIASGEFQIAHLPYKYQYNTKMATKYMMKHPEKAYIATKHYMGGFEPEAKIAPGVRYVRVGTPEYFIRKGKVVVVDTLKLGKPNLKENVSEKFLKTFTYSSTSPRPYSFFGTVAKSAPSYIRTSSKKYISIPYSPVSILSVSPSVSTFTSSSISKSKSFSPSKSKSSVSPSYSYNSSYTTSTQKKSSKKTQYEHTVHSKTLLYESFFDLYESKKRKMFKLKKKKSKKGYKEREFHILAFKPLEIK